MTSSRLAKFAVAACWVLGIGLAAACSSSSNAINCGDNAQNCDGTCTVIARDPSNCGACGKACAMGEVCSAGSCASACGGGTTKCGMECVDTKSDPRNCGSCAKACASNEVCMTGACATACGMGTTKCGMSCVSTMTDPTNCGGCGTMCKAGETCSGGMCGITCLQGLTKCALPMTDGGATGNTCVNEQTDRNNCGACGKTCAPAEICTAGICDMALEVTPPNGTLTEPGGVVYWSGRYFSMTFSKASTLTGVDWKANLGANDSITAEVWDPNNMTKVATGTPTFGAGSLGWYRSDINFSVVANKTYVIGFLISNGQTVFPRKDGATYPYPVDDLITISACHAQTSANTYPGTGNTWGLFMHVYAH